MAKKAGYAMSLWLHGSEDYISEAGAMNMFILKQAEDGCEFTEARVVQKLMADLEFITMGLENGIVLPGITRDSIIKLIEAHAAGETEIPNVPKKVRVVERDISMKELVKSVEDGSLQG